jgi:MFS family permease
MSINEQPIPKAFRSFLIIWIGQLVSLIGSQLTGFALGVWVYDQTRSVMWLALTQIAMQAPFVLLSPLAGVLADRWNRRTAMVVSDLGAGLGVLVTAILFSTNHLQPWMVIPINFWMAAFNTLMWPSYTASVTMLIPKQHYGRANGLVQLGEALPAIAGPAIAGALYVAIKLGNMALIDFTTYLFSVVLMLLFVRIPRPQQTDDGRQAKGSIWQEMKFGLDYILARKGLFSLLMYFLALNFLMGLVGPLLLPLILDNWKADVFGYLSTLWGVGILVGTLVMSAWGGGKRKIYTLLGAGAIGALFLTAVGLHVTIPFLAVCGFGFMFTSPLINASSQSIWQAKVAPDVQGRVFAVRRTIVTSTQIFAPLLAAPLADYVFKPGISAGGFLAPIFGPIVGVGANYGVGLLISTAGFLMLIISMLALFVPAIRNVEIDLPDHVVMPADNREIAQ